MARKTTAFLGAAAILAVANTAAAIRPIDGDFQINTYTSTSQGLAGLCADGLGGFVVVWASGKGQDGSVEGIFGQRFDGKGAHAGTEFQVNQYTTYNQLDPAICCSAGAGFTVVWQSDFQDGDGYGIFGRRYGVDGQPRADEFLVNTYTTDGQGGPQVACAGDGRFVVTWESILHPVSGGRDYTVSGQRYASDGIAAGTEFLISDLGYDSEFPHAAMRPDGSIVVAWTAFSEDGDLGGIFARQYDATGDPVGTSFQVNTYTTGDQYREHVLMRPDGGFVIAWDSQNYLEPLVPSEDGSFGGVFARRFDVGGAALGDPFQINTYTTDFQTRPRLTNLEDGGFMVVWESLDALGYGGQDGSGHGVFGRQYDSAGQPTSSEFQVNAYATGFQAGASVAEIKAGRFVVSWQSKDQDGDAYGIFGRLFELSPLCGDATDDGALTASDALVALRASVGTSQCESCVCDVNGSDGVTATDALAVLQAAVGLAAELSCASCFGVS
jgi:hypothetical protein